MHSFTPCTAGVHFYGLGHWDKIAADERMGLGSKLACVVNPNQAGAAAAAAADKQAAPASAQDSAAAGATPPPDSSAAAGELPGSGPSAAEKDKEGGEKGSGLPKGGWAGIQQGEGSALGACVMSHTLAA